VPTGSKDPFALRRAAQGLLKIIVQAQLPYDIQPLCGNNQDLWEFMRDRIRYYFTEVEGFPYDEVSAVLAVTPEAEVPLDDEEFKGRLIALHEIRSTDDFQRIAGAIKRIRKIREQAGFSGSGIPILEHDFDEGPERQLFRAYRDVVEAARTHFPRRECLAFLQAVARTRPSVDAFFDNVMVMHNDSSIRRRRLELLYRIDTQFNAIADFSEIVTAGEQKS
jgi:glycyl-tRNA synthetase beta chain